MRADTEDQLRISQPEDDKFPVVKLLLAVAVLAGLLLFWFLGGQEEAVEPPPPAPVVVQPIPEVAPDIPRRPEPEPVVEVEPEPVVEEVAQEVEPPQPPPLPDIAESNEMMREQLAVAGADARVNGLVGTEHPMEVSAALIDGVSRGILLRKILPASPPKEPFAVLTEGDALYMSESSYERYDGYASSIAALDTDLVIDSFHLLRPLYERAYEQLGLRPDDFDNAIIRALDIVLATPEIEEPIRLESKSVMYTFADPTLESLPTVQKQLLRTGPDNIRRIKKQARRLREGLLQSAE